MESGHEIISMAVQSLLLIRVWRLLISGERVHLVPVKSSKPAREQYV